MSELTLVALVWNPKTRKLETLEMPKSEIYQATQKLEKSQSEGKWTVAKFVYVTKTGEYAGAW